MMTPTITTYTTSDLSFYFADLLQTPWLSKEQEQGLLLVISSEQAAGEERRQAQHHLLLSYLRWACRLVKEHCPRPLWGELLPDLIGEVNLMLSLLFSRRDLCTIGDKLPSYVASAIRSTTSEALSRQSLIHIPYQARVRAREQGTWEQLRTVERLLSLDALMEAEGTHEGEEPPVFPLHSSETAPERNEEHRAQVEEYLSYLSPRAQMILRLRYGLTDENACSQSEQEIAHFLGTTRDVVHVTKRRAIKTLKALIEGKATLIIHRGKPTISYPELDARSLSPLEETELEQVYVTLFAQEGKVTLRPLAAVSGMGQRKAAAFLRTRREEREHQQNRGYGKRKRLMVESSRSFLHPSERMVQ